MNIIIIDTNSTDKDIDLFIELYKKSYNDLCIYNGRRIIDLSEYISNKNYNVIKQDMNFLLHDLKYNIYYTHNENVITCIAIIDLNDSCFTIVNYLCGNQTTRNNKINGKSQGYNMLDFIFSKFKNNIILIEPASLHLISYYVNYKKPSFPYEEDKLNETNGFLLYGNLSFLKEECFKKIFNSIRYIDQLIKNLRFSDLHDLYNNTSNLKELKHKLYTVLRLLNQRGFITSYDEFKSIHNIIDKIKYYDIDDIITSSLKKGGSKYHSKRLKRKNKKTRRKI